MLKMSIETSNTTNNNSELDKIEFLGAKIMLDAIIKEYKYEEERKKGLDSRAGIFLAFVGTLIILIPNLLTVPTLSYKIDSIIIAICDLANCLLYLSIFIMLLSTLFNFVKTMNVRNYNRLGYDSFSVENAKHAENAVAVSIMTEYRDNVIHNKKENDIKLRSFKKGISSMQITFILIVIHYLVNIF